VIVTVGGDTQKKAITCASRRHRRRIPKRLRDLPGESKQEEASIKCIDRCGT